MHEIAHTVGIYVGLLTVACAAGVVAKRFAHLPYTILLTLVGLAVGVVHLGPNIHATGFSHDLIFFVFLPPLLFQGAFHMSLDRLLKQFWPIVCLAVPGVIVSTLLVGGLVHWWAGVAPLMTALLFGALISPTDPVSVLALFRKARVPKDLKTLVEGESLFNDATGVVVFTIVLDAIVRGGGLGLGDATWTFFRVSMGGALVGGALGLAVFLVMRRLNDHLLENAICLTLAYGAFWLAERVGASGVIAVVMAGLLMGNYGRRLSMRRKTVETIETFFESIDFVVNSFLFILIGLELRELPANVPVAPWRLIVGAVAAMLVGRAVVAYGVYWGLNRVGRRRPPAWKHVLFWGGLRGSIPIALLLHLPTGPALGPWRSALLLAGFACVFFSLVIQGATMRPLLRRLGLAGEGSG